jgi:prepilin-type processing-associated H-X9-DG protein
MTAARLQCQNNLKQIGIALHGFHDTNQRFPSGIMCAVGSGSGAITPPTNIAQPPVPGYWGSWLTYILPFMDNLPLYDQIAPLLTGREYGYCTGPTSPGATVILAYLCPVDYVPETTIQFGGAYYFGVNSYFANAGTSAPNPNPSLNGVMYFNSSVSINQITDGTSNTLLAGERYSQDPAMTDEELAEVRGWAWCNYNSGEDHLGDTAWSINSPAAVIGTTSRLNNFGSGHGGGANFVLCDGSVQFVNQTISIVILQRLSVPNDGSSVSIDE